MRNHVGLPAGIPAFDTASPSVTSLIALDNAACLFVSGLICDANIRFWLRLLKKSRESEFLKQ
jgi:hypothetical protein